MGGELWEMSCVSEGKKVRGPAEAVDHRQRPGSLSAAPATQKQHPVHQVLHLPRKKELCGMSCCVEVCQMSCGRWVV